MNGSRPLSWKQIAVALAGAMVGFVGAMLALGHWPGSARKDSSAGAPNHAAKTTGTSASFKPSQKPVIDLDDVEVLERTDKAIAQVAKGVIPAVVNIFTSRTVTVGTPPVLDPIFGRLYRTRPQLKKSQSLGSGVFVSEDGYITSSYHLVAGAEEIQVLLNDGRMFDAVVVGSDPRIDIVVLKIDGDHFATIPFGDSDELDVGDFVLAVGNPYGFSHTVTRGIVSAVNRSGVGLNPYEDFIQTDAAVNLGNSGGALANSRAELVGINSAIISKGGGFQGISLATPINLVKEALPELIRGERISRGWMGVQVMVLVPGGALARQLNYSGDRGLVVTGVEPGGPAEKNGIQPGDVLQKIDDKALKMPRDFKLAVSSKKASESVRVNLWRNGKELALSVVLGEMPYGQEAAQ